MQSVDRFTKDLIVLPKLTRLDGPTRFYEVPTGEHYPSVTSVIGAMSDKSALEEWRVRVGQEEAEKITAVAGSRGSTIHGLCEQYVLGEPISRADVMPFNLIMFDQIKHVLDLHANNIRCLEGMLYSHTLRVAGAVDLVADWKGKPAIIDYKTSIKDKQRDWIQGYFLQASMYAFMFWEMTGILCNDIVVLIAIEQSPFAQVFEDKATKWLPSVKTLCSEYHKKYT